LHLLTLMPKLMEVLYLMMLNSLLLLCEFSVFLRLLSDENLKKDLDFKLDFHLHKILKKFFE